MKADKSLLTRIIKKLLDFGIFVYFVLIIAVLLTGGFKLSLFGISIRANHLYTPLKILVPLIFVRLLITTNFKNVLLLLVSVSMSLLMGEIFVRIWAPSISKPQMAQIHRASPIFGWELVPGSQGIGTLGESYHINSAGFRDMDHPLERSGERHRIMVIGDSFTFGAGVHVEHTYPKQLERILEEYGIPADVINCGVIGHNMWQHYEMLIRRVLPKNPDLVILGLFQDDLSHSMSPPKRNSTYQGVNPFIPEGVSRIFLRSSLWNLVRNANVLFEHKFRYRRGYDYMKGIEERKKVLGPTNPTDWNYKIMSGKAEKEKYVFFSRTLKDFFDRCNSAGAKVLVAMIPDAVQLNDPHMQAVNRIVNQTCSQIGIAFLDLTPIFEKEEDYGSLYLFPFDAHTSPKGLRLIAESIADKIVKSKLLSLRHSEGEL